MAKRRGADLKFFAQRLAMVVPTVLLVSLLIFLVMRLIPGDPAVILAGDFATAESVKQLRQEWGLDRPVAVQYLSYLKNLASGNMGQSIASRQPVTSEIAARFPVTLQLAFWGSIIAVVLGVLAGVMGATRALTGWDYTSMILSMVGISTPVFWSGLILILIFSVKLSWLPSGGTGTFSHMILPSVSLGLFSAGVLARQTRASMMEVLSHDYVRTARSKGLPERVVVYRHAMKNAMLPVVTIVGIQFGRMLGGAVLVESVFSLPGIGRFLIIAISQRDYPVVQGIVLLLAVSFVLINLMVDLVYSVVDPRIRQ
jgi:peptide/nickel transport system permease protein